MIVYLIDRIVSLEHDQQNYASLFINVLFKWPAVIT